MNDGSPLKLSPEILKLGDDFNRQMADSMSRVNAACQPAAEALREGIRRIERMITNDH